MNRVRESRDLVEAALHTVLDELGDGLWTIDRREPQGHHPPAAWINQPTMEPGALSNGTPIIVLTWPVTVTVDGSDDEQIDQLDELVPRLHDEFERIPQHGVTGWQPNKYTVDEEASVYGYSLTVRGDILATTLCPSQMTDEQGEPTP